MSTSSTYRRRLAVPLAIVLAVSIVPMLTGCFGNPIQNAIKAATGGKVDVGGGSLPSDFPSAVPVYKGTIVEAVALGKGSKEVWNVTVNLPGESAYNDIKSELSGAGFKIEGTGTGTTDGLIATNKTYSVIVGATEVGKQWEANYTVGPAGSGS
jgi:hypothetical protein